ncbi:ABC transporter substrate-binding protein [Parapedobacter lycopersici]|uniref:ABC transporter substrate-binding protein n=1 Tax=Parapedobacter lycopersici TaxID=1864939 RepID=UPI00214D2C22|nr:ABC transporter substrate-binding protein [Parapedobacter lycopersici]
MISVRNHRLPLNGSSFLIVILLLLAVGCTPRIRVLRPAGSQTEPKRETTTAEEREKDAIKETAEIDANQIALLLPFQLDKANQHAPSTVDIRRSALALDFYQGFKLGLDALSAQGVNFKVDVLDTRDDVAENARIAKTDQVQQATLVVGPVYPKEIQVFGYNASLDSSVLQISPLAASMPSEFDLPNLVTLTAPLMAHVEALATHIVNEYQTGDVVLFYQTEDAASRQFLDPLKARVRQLNSRIDIANVNDQASLESSIHLSGKNLLVMGTTNKYLISPILANLRTLRDELSYDIRLFGHPNWTKLDFDEIDGLAGFRASVTSSFYVNKGDKRTQEFDSRYRSEFGITPTEFAYKGYDAAYYFGSLLAKYGAEYKSHIQDETYNGLHNTFTFKYNPAWGYVNHHIWILQFRDGDFRPVN